MIDALMRRVGHKFEKCRCYRKQYENFKYQDVDLVTSYESWTQNTHNEDTAENII